MVSGDNFIVHSDGVFANAFSVPRCRLKRRMALGCDDAMATSFLLGATRVLASTLDLDKTLAAVAGMALPYLGCWCIVDLFDGEILRRVTIVHSDPDHQWMADRLLSGWPPLRDDPLGAPSAVRTRRSEVVFPVTDEMMARAAHSPENLAMLRALEIGSFMTVPLVARGAVLGAITYVTPNCDDSFTEFEQALAEDLAARCAIAIDNAQLYDLARAAQAKAEEANEAKMRFLSTMSHELRTPLNAIAGYTELLETGVRGPVTEAQLRDLRRIHVNQRHLLDLVEAVLGYARVDAGKVTFVPSILSMSAVLADASALVTPLAEKKGIIVRGWNPEDSRLTVFADREKLLQILVNVLANAIKFSPDGGTIDIACRAVEGHVDVRISDRGSGIAPEHFGLIFQSFGQVDEGLKKQHGGMGLGLAISRQFALGMEGDLFVESILGEGSTFTLTLPGGSDDPPTHA